jgi:phosphoribosylformylglycinamidine synthase
MWQFARAVEGMGAACRALDIPITGGNVSLYNETDGRAVLPTPVVGVVGLVEQADRVVRRTLRAAGDAVILLGDSRAELGGSEYLSIAHRLTRGVPPALDLAREAALQRVLVDGAMAGLIRSAHDCAEGGLAVTLAECCFDAGLGVDVDITAVPAAAAFADIATLFGESASRAVVSTASSEASALVALATAAGVPARQIGVAGGDRVRIAIDGRAVVDELVADLERIWSTTIESCFERSRALA